MKIHKYIRSLLLVCFVGRVMVGSLLAAEVSPKEAPSFPPSLEIYNDYVDASIPAILRSRMHQVPFNLAATIIIYCASIPTLTIKFHRALLSNTLFYQPLSCWHYSSQIADTRVD